MSLINDALKRANQTKPAEPAAAPAAPKLRVVEPPAPPASGPPQWLLFAFPVVLLLVCGIAGVLIYQGWHGEKESAPNGVTAAARVTQPEPTPIHPSNDWVSVPPNPYAATNATGNVAAVRAEPTFPELRLQGVFFRPSNPSAVINGKTVFRGERVDSARVVAIGKDSVTVEWKGQRRVLVIE